MNLKQFLEEHRIHHASGVENTLTGMGGEDKGSYHIDDAEYDTFLDLAFKHMFTKNAMGQNKACNLIERPRAGHRPVLIDLDFRYQVDGAIVLERRFGDEELRSFVMEYANAVAKFFDLDKMPKKPRFFVETKPMPEQETKNGITQHKDGVHIICPDITTEPRILGAIRGYLQEKGIISEIFGDTGFSNTTDDVFDKSVIFSNGWFIHGASKPDKSRYRVIAVYEMEVSSDRKAILTELNKSQFTDSELISLLSVRRNHKELNLIIDNLYQDEEATFTRLMSKHGVGVKQRSTTPAPQRPINTGNKEEMMHDPQVHSAHDNSISVTSSYDEDDIVFAYKLLEHCLIPDKRAKAYPDWIELGLCLYNISPTEKSYESWRNFSWRVSSYNSTPEQDYRVKWNQLSHILETPERRRKKMGTLHMWARNDRPDEYDKLLQNSNIDFAIMNLSGTHVSVASLMVKMYRHEFRCTPGGKKTTEWYQYVNNAWHHLKLPTEIRKRISGDIRNLYLRAQARVSERQANSKSSEEKDMLETKRKKLNDMIKQLEMANFKDSVMKECAEKFYEEDFVDKLDSNPLLVGVDNGVLELRYVDTENKPPCVFFRPGRPDDYVRFQMGRHDTLGPISYKRYNPNDPESDPEMEVNVQEIRAFFAQLFPCKELREYMLTLISACLEGENKEQRFYVLTGVGGNGKSALMKFMEMIFGDYKTSLETTALTRKRPDSNSANPDVVTMKCKRFVNMDEPEEGEKINTSRMKQFTGGDLVGVRALFQDQEKIRIMARIFMCCNYLPPVSSMDGGTWRRLRVIPFESQFKDPGDSAIDPSNNIYVKDFGLDPKKFTKWRGAMLALLVWYYENKYLKEGLIEPAIIKQTSDKYKEDNDTFMAFTGDNLERKTCAGLDLNVIYNRYKDWQKQNPNGKTFNKKDLQVRLTEVYGAAKKISLSKIMFLNIALVMHSDDESSQQGDSVEPTAEKSTA